MAENERMQPRLFKPTSMASLATSETAPLLSEPPSERREMAEGDASSNSSSDFDDDQDNPLEWSASFKWGIVALLAATGFVVTFTCMAVVPVTSGIADDLDSERGEVHGELSSVLPVTIWEVGEAIGPLLIAPLSEMYGRYPLMNAANLLFIAGTVLSALSPDMYVFIASRALTGMAVASNVLGPAIIGDIFEPEQRGMAMSVVGFSPLFGGTVGPACSGIISQNFGWRAVLWVSVVLASCCQLVLFTYFRETYRPVILRLKVRKTNKESGKPGGYGTVCSEDQRRADDEDEGGDATVDDQDHQTGLLVSITRPATVLFSSGVLAALSIFNSSVFAHFYILSTTLPGILEELYGLSPAATGSAFLANGCGSFIAIIMCRMWLDKIYIKLRNSNYGIGLPEHRLPMAVAAAFMLPVALMMYGWCAQYILPLPFLLVSVVLIRMFIVMVSLPLMAYVVDACGVYSASALTGVIVTRCLAGAFLPLGTAELVKDFGYGRGFTVLSAVSLTLAVVPLLLVRYGCRWRSNCPYTLG